MRSLLNVIITLLLFVPLIHCGLTDMIGPSVADKIECPNLDGAYKTNTDLFFNFIPLNQDYNVNIASGGKDVIIQIESADEEKNMICTIFSDVKLAAEDNSKIEFSSSESMVATTNSKSFGDTINSFHIIRFKDDHLDTSDHGTLGKRSNLVDSCKIKKLYVLKESYPSPFGLIDELVRDTNRVQKSFITIKRECSRFNAVNPRL